MNRLQAIPRRQAVLTLLLLTALVMAAGMVARDARPMAPAIAFTTLAGQPVRLSALRGKVVLVSFWATNCPGCLAEIPRLTRFYQQNRARGFELVAVAVSDDRPDCVLQYDRAHQLPFPVVYDFQARIARAFPDFQVTPSAFLIGRDGRILHQYTGEPDYGQLQAQVLTGTATKKFRPS